MAVDFELKNLQCFVGNHPPEGGIFGGDKFHLADGILFFYGKKLITIDNYYFAKAISQNRQGSVTV